jgi:preprotein translocase subunit Sss1
MILDLKKVDLVTAGEEMPEQTKRFTRKTRKPLNDNYI